MVEHDLAKVGVASSNLVSRSIFLAAFLFSTLLFSNDKLVIKNHYCIKQNTVFLKTLFPHQKQDIMLLKIPEGLENYKIPSIDIITFIKKRINLSIIDESGGIVTFDKQCFVNYDKKKIVTVLKKKFQDKYKTLKIQNILIKPINSFPKNFKNYNIKNLMITDQNLRKSNGNFIVLYKNKKDRISRIYFRFKIIAKITLFKAKNNITNGKILSQKNCERVAARFDKIPMNFIDLKSLDGYISRNYIRKGQILTAFLIKKKKLIQKRDSVTAIIQSGGLQLEFTAKALNSGNKNEYIQVINSSGKVFRVKIIGRGLVKVQ